MRSEADGAGATKKKPGSFAPGVTEVLVALQAALAAVHPAKGDDGEETEG
jgi:hypothetical protein